MTPDTTPVATDGARGSPGFSKTHNERFCSSAPRAEELARQVGVEVEALAQNYAIDRPDAVAWLLERRGG